MTIGRLGTPGAVDVFGFLANETVLDETVDENWNEVFPETIVYAKTLAEAVATYSAHHNHEPYSIRRMSDNE